MFPLALGVSVFNVDYDTTTSSRVLYRLLAQSLHKLQRSELSSLSCHPHLPDLHRTKKKNSAVLNTCFPLIWHSHTKFRIFAMPRPPKKKQKQNNKTKQKDVGGGKSNLHDNKVYELRSRIMVSSRPSSTTLWAISRTSDIFTCCHA